MTPTPGERLAASRERLRQALAPPPGGGAGPEGGMLLAAALARNAAGLLVQRHPLATVGAAALAGAVLLRWRPWRGLLRPALLAGALPLLLRLALRMPPGLWAQLLGQRSKKA